MKDEDIKKMLDDKLKGLIFKAMKGKLTAADVSEVERDYVAYHDKVGWTPKDQKKLVKIQDCKKLLRR